MKPFSKRTPELPENAGKPGRLRSFFNVQIKKADGNRSRNAIRIDRQHAKWQIFTLLVVALMVAVIIELFNRRDVGKFFRFIYEYPLMFLLDYIIVLNSIMVAQLFRRRVAVMSLVSLAWITLSVVNYVVICFRTQPFTLADVLLVGDMFSLITVYFNWFQIIMMGVAILALLTVLGMLFAKAPRRERVPYVPTVLALAVITAMSYCGISFGMNSGFISERFTSIKDAYQKYGFAYTFIDTFADIGISRPSEYNTDTVKDIARKAEPDTTSAPDVEEYYARPNIVFVQLESFFDADTLADDIIVSENATPTFHRMLTNWPSGTLYVPVVGGGTANTEFEILTGMNIDSFGAGEYPYYTVLRDTTCESMCYVLGRNGYSSAAVHNYMATFYGRDMVYANMGFEVFESMEYMDDLEYGEVGWATDYSVTNSIIDALEATEGRDFVFAVTVGTHGKYPMDTLLECASQDDSVRVIDPGLYFDQNQLQNYLNIARYMDDYIAELLKTLATYDEPIVCVLYGDHLPALDWDEACVDSGELFATQYFIWNNYGATFEAPDIQAYRLSANILLQLGIEDGVLFGYHQSTDIDDEGIGYLTELEILEYDMLYGEREAYDGEEPYEATNLRMGIHEIVINNANYRYGRLMIKGDGFNEFSKIMIDDEAQPTVYVDTHTLAMVMEEFPEDAESLAVAQISNENIELSRTEEYLMSDVNR